MARILFVGNPTGHAHLIAERLRAVGCEVEMVTDLSDVTNGEAWDIIATDEAFVPDTETLNRQLSVITLKSLDSYSPKGQRTGKGQRKANRAERWR